MYTIGLILSLDLESPDAPLLPDAVTKLPGCIAGPIQERWMPVAIEAESAEGCRTSHETIAQLPGVRFVDVVHVQFEAENPQ